MEPVRPIQPAEPANRPDAEPGTRYHRLDASQRAQAAHVYLEHFTRAGDEEALSRWTELARAPTPEVLAAMHRYAGARYPDLLETLRQHAAMQPRVTDATTPPPGQPESTPPV